VREAGLRSLLALCAVFQKGSGAWRLTALFTSNAAVTASLVGAEARQTTKLNTHRTRLPSSSPSPRLKTRPVYMFSGRPVLRADH
jgi:hypothetical protein